MKTLTGHFRAIADSRPDSVALCSAAGETTYRVLRQQASRIAGALRARGVRQEVPVGIALPRSEAAIASVLGVLIAGGAYVPIDPSYPPERQRFIAEDCGAPVILTAGASGPDELFASKRLRIDELSDDAEFLDFPLNEQPADALLYILYTSGSTGRPKGVCGTHAATLNRLRWGWECHPFVPSEVVSHRTSLNFVDSAVEIFSGLLQGVKTAIVSPEETADLALFSAALQRHHVTRLTVVPSLLAALLRTNPDLGTTLPQVRLWISSGEELGVELLHRFRAAHPQATLLNIYGSTEVTGDVTCATFLPGTLLHEDHVPIGSAMAGAELFIFDEKMIPVAEGNRGELYVGGPVLARGYHARPEEEARRFLPHPLQPEARIFRTGDVVRRRPDAQLDYLGRMDHQVKIRGIRVELEEVERTIEAALPQGGRIAVVAVGTPSDPGARRLYAFAAPSSVDLAALQRHAAAHLPAAAVPWRFVSLDSLPLTPNGKIDRRTLSERASASATRPHQDVRAKESVGSSPASSLGQQLARILSSVLGVWPVGHDDSLVSLGGDSLALAELMAALARVGGAHLEPAQVRHATVAEMTQLLTTTSAGRAVHQVFPSFYIEPSYTVQPAQLVHFICEIFAAREPLAVASGATTDTLTTLITSIVAACSGQELSFLARDRATADLVGFCMAHDLARVFNPLPEKIPRSIQMIVALLDELMHEYTQLRGPVQPGEVVDLQVTGAVTTVDGYVIADALEAHVLAAARTQGFKRAVTICTHHATARLAQRAGYQLLAARPYDRYVYTNERVFAALAPQHGEAGLYEKDLTS